MKKYVFSIAAAAAMFASCSQDADLEIIDNGPKAQAITTITASTQSENGSRAVVDGTSINWETGDQLGAFGTGSATDGNGWFKSTAYTLDEGAGFTSGTFENGGSTLSDISATMYPYQEDARFLNGELHYDIPTVQTGVKGSFDKRAAIMYGLNDVTSLSLGVNFLRVHIGEANIHSVSISSPSSQLSGRVSSNGACPDANQEIKSVTLVADPNNPSSCFMAGNYYIAVKPGAIANPTISYVYIYADEHAAEEWYKTSSGTISFNSSNVKDISVTWGRNPNKRGAVQLWAGGPYFAEYNVGVTDGKPESYGGYYAWGGSVNKGNDHNTGTDALTGNADTATKLWGSAWRMPTDAQLQGLLDNCTKTWTDNYNSTNVKGRIFTGQGNSIFLPGAGRCSNGTPDNQGKGRYWSSTPSSTSARYLYFNSDTQEGVSTNARNVGFSVRAVLR